MENVKTTSSKVLQHLETLATEKGESLDALLGLYVQERLLYRLSVSPYQERFLLKDDVLLFALTNGAVKTSREMALAAKQMPKDMTIIKQAIIEICSIHSHEDGIHFLEDKFEFTWENEEIQVNMPVTLAQTKTYIEVSISFGDSLLLTPKIMAFPSLLDMPSPMILVYPKAFIIAEKFEKMTSLPASDCRMKDFYDIYMLSTTQKIEGRVLQEAIAETFDNHRTTLEKDHPVFSKHFYLDTQRNKAWLAFIGQQPLKFEEVMKRIQTLLWPIYNEMVKEDEFFKNWDNTPQHWT